MRYTDFKRAIYTRLRVEPAGRTWAQLKEDLRLPYDRPCPEWTRRLEEETGLVRRKGSGNALVWRLEGTREG